MKICSGCGQVVAEEVNTCPSCGTEMAAGAVRHYREALGSYMDHRIEYDFAMGRLKRLRQKRPWC